MRRVTPDAPAGHRAGLEHWPHAPHRPEQEAAARPLRRARADPGRSAAARGRGPQDPQAEHRQHRTVRLRGARGDRRRHDPQPAREPGLRRLARHLLGAYGGRAVLPVARTDRHRRRRRLHRQRGLRADHDGAAGVRRRPQRGARPGPRLPAVDRCRLAVRRHPGALPLRRGQRLEPRPGRHRGQDHREHPRPGDHQPEQPHRRRVLRGDGQGPHRHRPPPRAGGHGRRDLREDPLRRRGAPPRGELRRRRRALPDLQRPVQGLPGVRLPRRLGHGVGAEAPGRGLPRGPDPAVEHADVRERARPARDPDRSRRATSR